MNEDRLLVLVGRTVIDVDLTPQDAGLLLDGQITLNIYNQFVVTGLARNDARLLVEAKVMDVQETQDLMFLEFDAGVRIEVDLRDSAYTSPEAVQLRIPGRPIIVWN